MECHLSAAPCTLSAVGPFLCHPSPPSSVASSSKLRFIMDFEWQVESLLRSSEACQCLHSATCCLNLLLNLLAFVSPFPSVTGEFQ